MSPLQERKQLHSLVDMLPASEVDMARRFLEFLCAGIDKEPLSSEDLAAIEEGRQDILAGRVTTLEQVKSELGFRAEGSKLARAKRQHALLVDPDSIVASDAELMTELEAGWRTHSTG